MFELIGILGSDVTEGPEPDSVVFKVEDTFGYLNCCTNRAMLSKLSNVPVVYCLYFDLFICLNSGLSLIL
jgi:hypothetical protein